MDEGEIRLSLEQEIDGRAMQGTVTVSESDYPCLVELLGSPKGEALKEELRRLIGRFWKARAARRPVKLFAKLSVAGADEESVLVQDISSSGIRVAVSQDVALDVKSLGKVHFRLAVREGEERRRLKLEAEFVRVAHADDTTISLAFRFTSVEPEVARLLETSTNLFFT